MKRRCLLVVLSVAACGKEPPQIWRGEAVLGDVPLVVTPVQPIEAAGPTHRVCVVPAGRGVRAEWDSLLLPDGGSTRLRVTLITPDDSATRCGMTGTSRHSRMQQARRSTRCIGRRTHRRWTRNSVPYACGTTGSATHRASSLA